MAKLEDVEGIGSVQAQKLKAAGVVSLGSLLETGKTPKGRAVLADKTGISEKLILEWVNHADLYRIRGVGSEFSDLLEAAGVDTVVELARRVPENLHKKLLEVNEERKLVRRPPSITQVTGWVEQAAGLPRIIEY
jgi:predicted flap endonuclease-1-like 5' DNA nuclease